MTSHRSETGSAGDTEPPRLLASLRQFGLTLLGMTHTRLALAGVEIEEMLLWLVGLILGALGLLVFGLAGLLSLLGLIVFLVDPAHRWMVLAVFAFVFLALGGWFWWRIQRALVMRPVFLQATMTTLAQDSEALQAACDPETFSGKASHE